MEGSILLIDDEEQLLKLFTRTLKLEGYDITQAKNIAEAFKARDRQPGKTVCGSTGTNMCPKKKSGEQTWNHAYTSPWLLEGPPLVGNMFPYEL